MMFYSRFTKLIELNSPYITNMLTWSCISLCLYDAWTNTSFIGCCWRRHWRWMAASHYGRLWDLYPVYLLARVDNTEQRRWGSITVKSSQWLFQIAHLRLSLAGRVTATEGAIANPWVVLIEHHLVLNAIFLQLDIFLHFVHQQFKKMHMTCCCIGFGFYVFHIY